MSRWRPPAPRSAPYITQEGYDRLSAELKYLWKEKRPEVTQAVKEAAAQGDRSENAEYIYGKKQLREIDRRIRYLSKRLDNINVVNRIPDDQNTVFFGAWVTLEDEEGESREHRIVGADEIGDKPGYISVDAPLARLMLKKQAGDEIWLKKPDGSEEWFEIIAVNYR